MTDARSPEAGWYPDPAGSLGERWWTGASWSEHFRPYQAPGPSVMPEPPGVGSPHPEFEPQDAAIPHPEFEPQDTAIPHPESAEDDEYVPLFRRSHLPPAVAGKGRLKNVLAYRSVNIGVTAAILFVATVLASDVAVHASPLMWMSYLAVSLAIIGTAIGVAGILLAVVSFFRIPTYRGLGPGLTGLVLGGVFAFTIPLAALTLRFLLVVAG